MKINLNIELDLPDGYADWSKEELAQFLFDEYVHYVPHQHMVEALNWCVKAKVDTPEEDLVARRIYESHRQAGDWSGQSETTWRSLRKVLGSRKEWKRNLSIRSSNGAGGAPGHLPKPTGQRAPKGGRLVDPRPNECSVQHVPATI